MRQCYLLGGICHLGSVQPLSAQQASSSGDLEMSLNNTPLCRRADFMCHTPAVLRAPLAPSMSLSLDSKPLSLRTSLQIMNPTGLLESLGGSRQKRDPRGSSLELSHAQSVLSGKPFGAHLLVEVYCVSITTDFAIQVERASAECRSVSCWHR